MIMLHDLCVTVCVGSEGNALFHIISMYFGCIPLFSNLKQWSHESNRGQSRRPLQALWMFLLSSHWLTSSRAPPCAKWISTVGKRLSVNALTESEHLNDTEYRSESSPNRCGRHLGKINRLR